MSKKRGRPAESLAVGDSKGSVGDAEEAIPVPPPAPNAVPGPANKTDSELLSDALPLFEDYFADRTSYHAIGGILQINDYRVRKLLRIAYEQRIIRLEYPADKSERLSWLMDKWPETIHHVLKVNNEEFFSRASAEVFFAELNLLLTSRDKAQPLHIGIVSGNTTGGMIEKLCEVTPWGDRVRSDDLPGLIYVYALNVSQTRGYGELRGNANVLAFELARKIRKEYGEQVKVEAFGLSTHLLQSKEEARRTDTLPEMSAVLKFTDPVRLKRSFELQREVEGAAPRELASLGPLPATSQLDIVVAGVGSIQSSLFRTYCEQHEFDIAQLAADEKVVGDIAYTPVMRNGSPKPLQNRGQAYEFYSAVSLDVLTKMSQHRHDKKVIILARNTRGSDKVDPILAALHGKHCNVLISDKTTSDKMHQDWR